MTRSSRFILRGAARWEQVVPVLALLAVPALTSARPLLEYESRLGSDSPLVRPGAISVGSDASLCVTDEGAGTLDVFDTRGFHRFRTDEVSGIVAPRDGSIDSRGRFVYIETGGGSPNGIARLNFLGEPEAYEAAAPYEGWNPLHLTIAGDGNYLTVDGEAALTKHDAATGAVLWTVRLLEGDFERADLSGRPAESADGTLYVPLTGARQIAYVSRDGQLEGHFGIPGSKPGELTFPVGVAVAGSGHIVVLDRMRHSILIYSGDDHSYLGESGRIGHRAGELYHPVAIAASDDGRVYVAQGFEGRVQQFRLLDTEFTRKDSES